MTDMNINFGENLPAATPLEITHENKKINIVMDMSMLDLFLLCPQRYYIRHMLRKEPPTKATALDTGSLLHEGMEVYFTGIKEGIPFADRINAATLRISEYAADPENSNLNPEDTNQLIDSFIQSCEYWRFEDENLEIHEVEKSFAYVLYEDEHMRIVLIGKIDLLMTKRAIGRGGSYIRTPMDHKSFKRDFPIQRLSNQFMNYCVATGSPFLIVNRVGLQKSLKPEEKFKRIPLSYDPIMLEDWMLNITNIITSQYLTCLTENKWFMNYTSCLKFNRMCENADICETSGEEAKQFKLNMHFRDAKIWDVTSKLKKRGE